MKRTISLLAAAALLLMSLFTACATATAPLYKRYTLTAEKNRGAFSSAARVTVDVTLISFDHNEQIHPVRLRSEIRKFSPHGIEPQIEIVSDFHLAEYDDRLSSHQMYYKEGHVYAHERIYGVMYNGQVRESIVSAPLNLLDFPFNERDIIESSAEAVAIGQGYAAERISFTLSSNQLQNDAKELFAYFLFAVGDYVENVYSSDEIEFVCDDIVYEITLGNDGRPVGCTASFYAEVLLYDQLVGVEFSIALDDIRFNTLTGISFPSDLDEYPDFGSSGLDMDWEAELGEDWEARLEAMQRHFENRYDPTFYAPEVISLDGIGEDSPLAMFLAEEGHYLDYYFWLAYQAVSGISAPEPLTGFASPAEISSEGLMRFFCSVNEFSPDSIIDITNDSHSLPDNLIRSTLDKFFASYNYNPDNLPDGIDRLPDALLVPAQFIIPGLNVSIVETAEILDKTRIRLTATRVNGEFEPVNAQELILVISEYGSVMFESYSIKPL